MNYSLVSTTGQSAYGYVELYKNEASHGQRTAVSVYYLPEGFNEHPNARVAITILTEISLESFQKSDLHEIMEDIITYVKCNASKYFKNPSNLNYIDTLTLHINNIDDVSEITHGDYGIN